MQLFDLFSGSGSFSIAAQELDITTTFFCENNKFCQKLLKKRFPGVPIYPDIKNLNNEKISLQTDQPIIISGGFPCQPFSHAGKRKGSKDSRHIIEHVYPLIEQFEPQYFIFENVPGVLNIEFGRIHKSICNELENKNYEVQTIILPASTITPNFERKRVFILANSNRKRQFKYQTLPKPSQKEQPRRLGYSSRLPNWQHLEPPICRTVNGIPNKLDRFKVLGNAVPPQIAYILLKTIQQIEKLQFFKSENQHLGTEAPLKNPNSEKHNPQNK